MRILRSSVLVSVVAWGSISLGQESGTDGSAPVSNESNTATTDSAPTASSGAGFSCTMNKLTRTVQVAYENSGAKTPCKVNYTKETEAPGVTQVLFSAAAEEGYCEKKAGEFVEKLKASGWTCSAQ